MYAMGDFNSLIGNEQNFIQDINDLPVRNAIDHVQNTHGDILLDFLIDSKFCIVNGRINQEQNNFILVDPASGSSVVDYLLVPHTYLGTVS